LWVIKTRSTDEPARPPCEGARLGKPDLSIQTYLRKPEMGQRESLPASHHDAIRPHINLVREGAVAGRTNLISRGTCPPRRVDSPTIERLGITWRTYACARVAEQKNRHDSLRLQLR